MLGVENRDDWCDSSENVSGDTCGDRTLDNVSVDTNKSESATADSSTVKNAFANDGSNDEQNKKNEKAKTTVTFADIVRRGLVDGKRAE